MTNYILFDDLSIKENLLPLTYFRPVSEIRCGILTLKEKWEYYLQEPVSYFTEVYLHEKFPPVFEDDNIFINAAVFPNPDLVEVIQNLDYNQMLIYENDIIATRTNSFDFVNKNFKLDAYTKDIEWLRNTYDIFQKNVHQIIADFDLITYNKNSKKLSPSNTVIGKHPVFIEESAKVEATVFNTDDGPVYIGKKATILEGSLIRGPFAMLDNAVVKMGTKIYQGTTIGPGTKVGGEIKNVVFFGNSNKGHDGYLGDSVVAEWCNLGAGTNNSNLKNNYSNVKLWNYSKKNYIDTGLQFCGLIMGDHSKCGIATMFNTGTVVGVSSNIFGGDYQPKFFPSFRWGGQKNETYRFKKAMEVAAVVYGRRNKNFDKTEQNLFKAVYQLTKLKEKIN